MKILKGHVLREHVLLGGLVALLLLPVLGGWGSLGFWLANVLIDLDHYLHFFSYSKFKTFSPRAMFQFHEELFVRTNRPEFLAIAIFHTVEFLLFSGILVYGFFPALRPLFWGMLFHNGVDLVHLARFGILSKRAHSLLEYVWRRKRMRAQGIDPDSVFFESLQAQGHSRPEPHSVAS